MWAHFVAGRPREAIEAARSIEKWVVDHRDVDPYPFFKSRCILVFALSYAGQVEGVESMCADLVELGTRWGTTAASPLASRRWDDALDLGQLPESDGAGWGGELDGQGPDVSRHCPIDGHRRSHPFRRFRDGPRQRCPPPRRHRLGSSYPPLFSPTSASRW